jgi:hypothetical protein
MSIVNRCGINLEDAFRAKEARNESRVWVLGRPRLMDAPGMACTHA